MYFGIPSNSQIIKYSISSITKLLFKTLFTKALQNKFENIIVIHSM